MSVVNQDDLPPATEFCAVQNGIVHLPTGLLWPPTPQFFTTAASPISFDPETTPPLGWLEFLAALWPDDQAAIDTLGEWFGYSLTASTAQQKILMIIGPPRSGKGTIARILREVIGAANMCGPSLTDLAGTFGLAPLIGKTLAIISDARLSKRSDQGAILERLLTVSGEDSVSIDRKHQSAWEGRLSARFMMMTNEVPSLVDASGAFASRLIVLQLETSFLGSEDLTLGSRLEAELPQILSWAVEGWQRLQARGHFLQPESARNAMEVLRETSSDIDTFVREHCVLGLDQEVAKIDLYERYKAFRKAEGFDGSVTVGLFGKRLHSICPKVRSVQRRNGNNRERIYVGISLETTDQPGLDL